MRALFVLLVAVFLSAGLLVAMQPPEAARASDEQAVGDDDPSGLDTINRILEEDREALEEEAVLGYDDGGRRDPFRSLLVRRNRPDARGPRPPGIPGLVIDDVTLKGVFMTPQGGVAQVQTSQRGASFLLRVGDQLYDGEVVDIRFQKDDVAEIVFKQGVVDPSAIRPFREVVKKITP